MNNIELAASYDISDRSILSFFVGTKLKANPRRGYSRQKTAYDPDGLVTLDMSCDNRTKMRDNETTVTVDYETVYGEEGQDGKFYAGYKFYTRPYRSFNTNYYDVVRLSELLIRGIKLSGILPQKRAFRKYKTKKPCYLMTGQYFIQNFKLFPLTS